MYNITKEKCRKTGVRLRIYILLGILVLGLFALKRSNEFKIFKFTPGNKKAKAQLKMLQERQNIPSEKAGFSVMSSGMGTGIENKSLIGEATVFPSSVGRVYYFAEIVWHFRPGGEIFHNWYYNGQLKSQVKLKVDNIRHRTWSYKTIPRESVGKWVVNTADSKGTVVDSKVFQVKTALE